jgi:hypothetical protein
MKAQFNANGRDFDQYKARYRGARSAMEYHCSRLRRQ